MKNIFNLAGIWWTAENPANSYPGVLSGDEEPQLEIFQKGGADANIEGDDANSLKQVFMNQKFHLMHGLADNRHISLIDAFCISTKTAGVSPFTLQRSNFKLHEIWGGQAHIDKDTTIKSIGFTFDGIQQIIGSNLVKHKFGSLVFADVPEDVKVKQEIFRASEVYYVGDEDLFSVNVFVEGKRYLVSVAPIIDASFDSHAGTSLNGRSFFRVDSEESANIEELMDIATQIKLFISYCCCAKIGLSDVSASLPSGARVSMLWQIPRKAEELCAGLHPIGALFRVSFDKAAAAQALKTWLEDDRTQRTSRWFTYEALGTHSYGPAKYLSAVQAWELLAESAESSNKLNKSDYRQLVKVLSAAIEQNFASYQADFLKSRLSRLNTPALHDKLEVVFSSIKSPVAKKIMGPIPHFVKQVVDLRNKFSHINLVNVDFSNNNFRTLMIFTCKLASLSCIYQIERLSLPFDNLEQSLMNNRVGKLALENLP